MGLDQYMRVFRCEGGELYAIAGAFILAGVFFLVARLAGWDNSYIYRMWFVVFTAVGVLAGGGVYMLVHGSC